MRARPHFNPFTVREPDQLPHFPDHQTIDLEIGCSTGRWMIGYAKLFPKRAIVGVEIRLKYIDHVRQKIDKEHIPNAQVSRANISTAVPKLFKPGQLGNVFIMFPDPWYKKKHFKRRVVNPEFLNQLGEYMAPGSELHIATDQEQFGKEMLADCERCRFFVNKFGKNTFANENIPGIITDIEEYNLDLGKPIARMVFERK
jgi:tRNA (guanine-N7-)-methyltransferase